MLKEFECLKCHHKFMADDRAEVVCPKCTSDNVRPATTSVTDLILKIVAFVFAIGIGFFVTTFVKNAEPSTADEDYPAYSSGGGGGGGGGVSSSVSNDVDVIAPDEIPAETTPDLSAQVKKIQEEAKKVKVEQPITLAIKTPVAAADGTYSFVAKAEHLPEGVSVREYRLTTIDGKTIVEKSVDGVFKGIPASETKGRYNLLAELNNGDIVSKDGVSGFDKVQQVKEDNRMQPEELTKLINSRDKALGRGNHPKVVRNAKIIINNKSSENDNQVRIMDDIYGRIEFGEWSSVVVTEVGYDPQGRINKIAININK